MKLGVYLGWHVHPWEDLLELVRRAEDLGYAAAFVDGDVSMLTSRPDADCLDGWTVTCALLASTERIGIGSLRLVHHWSPARLAQAVASAERLAPGRLRFQITIGDRAVDTRFGLAMASAAERIARLDATLDALRALWRGETVTRPDLQLDRARVRPACEVPITVAGKGRRLLEVVAAHADVWDVNLPPIRARVERAAGWLADACRRRGRDPAEIARSMLIFARSDLDRAAALAEYRRLNPWFRSIPDPELAPALVLGEAPACRDGIAQIASELSLALPVLDLSGVPAPRARLLLEALRPE